MGDATKAVEQPGRREPFYWVLICVIVAVAILIRHFLDHAPDYLTEHYLMKYHERRVGEDLTNIAAWRYFFPVAEMKGTWSTTGFILIFYLEKAFGIVEAHYLLVASSTVAVAFGALHAFGSRSASVTAAALWAFSPFNYSVYFWSGSNNAYTVVALLCLAIGFFAQYLRRPETALPYWAGVLCLSEFVKPLYLKTAIRMPASRGMAAVIMERMIDILVISTAALLALGRFADVIGHGVWIGVIAAGLGGVAVALVLERPVMFLIRKLPLAALSSFLERLYLQFVQVVRSLRLLAALALGVAGWTASYLGIHFLIQLAGSVDVTMTDTLFVFVLTLAGGAIGILPAGLGTYQAAAIFGLQIIGFGLEEALVLSAAMHVLSLLFEVPFSAFVLLSEDLSLRDFRIRGGSGGEVRSDAP